MPTEYTTTGYESIRQYMDPTRATPEDWSHIALIDDGGNEELRVSVSGDSRAQWTHAAGDQTLVAEITVSGSDSDITLPVTITEARMYQSSSATNHVAVDTFTGKTLDEDTDDLKVTMNLETPQVV